MGSRFGVDDKQVLTVRSEESELGQQLVYFCPKANAGWPWLAVPLRSGARDGVVRGMLAVDSFELVLGATTRSRQSRACPSSSSASALIGTALDLKSKHDSLEQLAMLQKSGAGQHTKLTIESVYALGLEALHKNILFAQRLEIWQLRNSALRGA